MAIRKLALLAAVVATLGAAASSMLFVQQAKAYSCTTQCMGDTCYTNCF